MKNKLKGVIFFNKKIKDNDLFIKVLLSNDQINSGIVYGGNSSKKETNYQNGFFLDFIITRKNENLPLIFMGDISTPYIGTIYEDKYKMNALLSILSLINLSIIEGQKINGFFKDVENLVNNIVNKNHWIFFYCEWLFILLQKIGYEIDYKKNINKQYFNLIKQDFIEEYIPQSIEFPHNLFSQNFEVNFENINAIFAIFESIFLKNHLENNHSNMPINFKNFKKIILQRLKF